MRIVIELAGAIRGKGAGRAFNTSKGPRVFQDSASRKWETEIRHAGERAMAGRAPTELPVSIIIEARFPIPTSSSKPKTAAMLRGLIRPTIKPDYDNICKSIGDGLNLICWQDDKQIVEATVRKIYSDRPGLTVIVETIEPRDLFTA
jgi:Holliday junction resolvase RusA-like endonuclease